MSFDSEECITFDNLLFIFRRTLSSDLEVIFLVDQLKRSRNQRKRQSFLLDFMIQLVNKVN